MKTPSLELFVAAWQVAPADRKSAALEVLQTGAPEQRTGPRVLRWADAARELSVSVRALRYATDAAGIEPVKLPGRSRSIGIRERDLALLAGEGEG